MFRKKNQESLAYITRVETPKLSLEPLRFWILAKSKEKNISLEQLHFYNLAKSEGGNILLLECLLQNMPSQILSDALYRVLSVIERNSLNNKF